MFPQHALLVGSYDYRLVGLSVVIATFASYAALDLAGRVTIARGSARFGWLAGGASAMSLGIWSMHYIGMLAFRMPIPVWYDWPMVLLSLSAARSDGLGQPGKQERKIESSWGRQKTEAYVDSCSQENRRGSVCSLGKMEEKQTEKMKPKKCAEHFAEFPQRPLDNGGRFANESCSVRSGMGLVSLYRWNRLK
jgi:signaling repeat-containing protein